MMRAKKQPEVETQQTMDRYRETVRSWLRAGALTFLQGQVIALDTEVSDRGPTMATDGRTLQINPGYAATLGNAPEGRAGATPFEAVLYHEALHALLQHPRIAAELCQHFPVSLLNIAADIVVDLLLDEDGVPLSVHGAVWSKLEPLIGGIAQFRGDSFQTVLWKLCQRKTQLPPPARLLMLPETEPGEGKPLPDHSGAVDVWGAVADVTERAKRETAAALTRRCALYGNTASVAEARIRAGCVIMPPWWDQVVGHLRRVTGRGSDRTSRSWRMFSQASYCATGCIFPARRRERWELDVAVDQSGSIGDCHLAHWARQLLGALRRASLRVWHFDIGADDPYRVASPSQLHELRRTRCGGTSFVEVLQKMEAARSPVAVIFTDGDGAFPDTPPAVPVLWLLSDGDRSVPFGTKVLLPRIQTP